jgi:hypothetical protein
MMAVSSRHTLHGGWRYSVAWPDSRLYHPALGHCRLASSRAEGPRLIPVPQGCANANNSGQISITRYQSRIEDLFNVKSRSPCAAEGNHSIQPYKAPFSPCLPSPSIYALLHEKARMGTEGTHGECPPTQQREEATNEPMSCVWMSLAASATGGLLAIGALLPLNRDSSRSAHSRNRRNPPLARASNAHWPLERHKCPDDVLRLR